MLKEIVSIDPTDAEAPDWISTLNRFKLILEHKGYLQTMDHETVLQMNALADAQIP